MTEFPLYDGPVDPVREVDLDRYAVVEDDEIVATDGLFTCLGIVVRDDDSGFYALSHTRQRTIDGQDVSNPTFQEGSWDTDTNAHLEEMMDRLPDGAAPEVTYLHGEKTYESLVEEAERTLDGLTVDAQERHVTPETGGVAVDADGTLYEYDPRVFYR